MTGSQAEIDDNEQKLEESTSKTQNENSSSYYSEIDISENNDDEDNSFITEKFIKEHNENLENRVQHLKNTVEALRKQLNEEKEMWRKEVEELNQIQASENESLSTCNLSENYSENTNNISIIEYQNKYSVYNQETLIQTQAEQKATVWRTIALAEYKRQLLEVESMCNLELIRVKQNFQSLQPLQKIISEWNDQTGEKNSNSDEITSTKSTATIATENDNLSDNTKESSSKLEDEIKIERETESSITPRSKIYNDFAEVCAKMQSFMMGLPMTAAGLTNKNVNIPKTQSAMWYSAYSLH